MPTNPNSEKLHLLFEKKFPTKIPGYAVKILGTTSIPLSHSSKQRMGVKVKPQ